MKATQARKMQPRKRVDRGEIVKRSDMLPLSAEEQQMWDRLDRGPRQPGRPKVGQGAKNVLISLELGLLERTDTFAKARGVGRSQLIAKAIERYLRDAMEIETDFQPLRPIPRAS